MRERQPIGHEDYLPLEDFVAFLKLPDCEHCKGSGEIETDNNGPIGECPVCDGYGKQRAVQHNDQLKPPRVSAVGLEAPVGRDGET